MGKKIYLTILWIFVLAAILVGVSVHVTGWFNFSSKKAGKVQEDSIETKAFDSIEMDVAFADLHIDDTSFDGYRVEYSASDAMYAPDVTVRRNTLIVKQKNIKSVNVIGTSKMSLDLTVYVPKGTVFQSVDLDVSACDLDLKDLSAESLELDSGAGDIKIEGGTFTKISMNVGAGDVDVADTEFDVLDIDAGAGDVDISGLGDIEEYSFDISVGVGNLSINGTDYSGIGKDYNSTGNSDKKIVIDGGLGDVKISE